MAIVMHIELEIQDNWDDFSQDLRRINREMDFSQVVLTGINAIQSQQRRLAPVGKTGPGPHGRIARNIRPARIVVKEGEVSATSRTSYGPAIFTSLGTGRYGPGGDPYEVVQHYDSGEERKWTHPGIEGTGWWERGANLGAPIALQSFQRKVETVLKMRGR
jgi:hypothetical protein